MNPGVLGVGGLSVPVPGVTPSKKNAHVLVGPCSGIVMMAPAMIHKRESMAKGHIGKGSYSYYLYYFYHNY